MRRGDGGDGGEGKHHRAIAPAPPLPDAPKIAMFTCNSIRCVGRAGVAWPAFRRAPLQERQTLALSPRFRPAILAAALLTLSAPAALARQSQAVAAPFEVGDSQAGNYLAALIAGAERDTVAASTYFREALRGDPRNIELTERAFLAALSNGNMRDAFQLAARLANRPGDASLANLALGVQALKQKRYQTARTQFLKGGTSRARDVTSLLLTAWAFVGSNDSKRSFETIDRLNENNVSLFRNYHAGLIADFVNKVPEASARFKLAYDADSETLRLVDAYARFLSKRGKADEAKGVYEKFERLLPRHPIVTAAMAELKSGKALRPFVDSVEAGAAEVLYGLGAAGGRQNDELAALIYLRMSLYLKGDNALSLCLTRS